MKNKLWLIVPALVVACAFALGAAGVFALARPELEDAGQEPDRLIGAFVTTQSLDLFDAEGYFADNADQLLSGGTISQSQADAYQGRLYAVLEDGAYVFPDTPGFRCFAATYREGTDTYTGSCQDETVSDVHLAVNATDDGDSLTLTGTIYVSTQAGPRTFFCNPVYQTGDGAVYAMAGDGMSMGGDEPAPGQSHAITLTEQQTVAVQGGTNSQTASSVTVTVAYVAPPQRVTIVQMGAEDAVLSRTDYAPEAVPEQLTTQAGTQYLLVESQTAQETTRALFQPGDETLEAFRCRADGVCVKQCTQVTWR